MRAGIAGILRRAGPPDRCLLELDDIGRIIDGPTQVALPPTEAGNLVRLIGGFGAVVTWAELIDAV